MALGRRIGSPADFMFTGYWRMHNGRCWVVRLAGQQSINCGADQLKHFSQSNKNRSYFSIIGRSVFSRPVFLEYFVYDWGEEDPEILWPFLRTKHRFCCMLPENLKFIAVRWVVSGQLPISTLYEFCQEAHALAVPITGLYTGHYTYCSGFRIIRSARPEIQTQRHFVRTCTGQWPWRDDYRTL